MKPTRREALAFAAQAGALWLAGSALGQAPAPLKRLGLGVVIHSYGIRRSRNRDGDFADPFVFLEYCRSLGAAGIQTNLGTLDATGAERLRRVAVDEGMYVEGIVALPESESDQGRFSDELQTAAACGASVVRTVMLSGRRYETFDDRESFDAFKRDSFRRLEFAKSILERQNVRLAVENHKDWRVDELLEILQRIDCELIGVCVDTGNSIALLEEPHEVVESYAPAAFTTHFKDMAVQECPDGFLLSEVPLGAGYLDLPRMVRTLRARQPDVRLNLEMITRDPLRVPCLGKQYWATFEQLSGRQLAVALASIREQSSQTPLPRVADKNVDEKLKFEDDNVRTSFQFAGERLTES